ncbi:hypothetical protein TIFTF001_054047 [Ficus carica]|uniref:Uncharacterized protein n=1 Tax=Ficus carica TaxID=3494 RepID=A0AA88EAN7_FICCA|nr:hypothetical protein TIFTF001_054044 [Ficus carica]GMN71163.1 hypothetical protein TIFTF001_054045 [Ficus carica]GMN71169.1 hypothetical protein TIFTF001_054046 [Ficus carica]GMN71173.1 hypothetical protein TIFTF001_054047 [Ficus carica]
MRPHPRRRLFGSSSISPMTRDSDLLLTHEIGGDLTIVTISGEDELPSPRFLRGHCIHADEGHSFKQRSARVCDL